MSPAETPKISGLPSDTLSFLERLDKAHVLPVLTPDQAANPADLYRYFTLVGQRELITNYLTRFHREQEGR